MARKMLDALSDSKQDVTSHHVARESEVRLMPTSVSGSDRPDLMKN